MDKFPADQLADSLTGMSPPDPWRNFKAGRWRSEIDVRDFILRNVTPYEGGPAFLAGPTVTITALFGTVTERLGPFDRKRRHRRWSGGALRHVLVGFLRQGLGASSTSMSYRQGARPVRSASPA